MDTGWKPVLPNVLEWMSAELMKGLVQTTTVGMPRFSRAIASCIQHAVQEPQSAMAVTTKSHRSVRRSMTSSAAGLE